MSAPIDSKKAYIQKTTAKKSSTGEKAPETPAPGIQPEKKSSKNKQKPQGLLFEAQEQAPAPNNTFYHFQIFSDNRVILLDWPRQRLTQKWTREGGMNPGMVTFSFKEYLDGELKDEITKIFGKPVYLKTLGIVKDANEA